MAEEKPLYEEPAFRPELAGASGTTRREFIATAALGLAVATAAALLPLQYIEDFPTLEDWLKKHYKELTSEEKEAIFDRIRKQVEMDYGVRPHLTDPPALDGVQFAYALNIGRCVGCRRCVYACMKENNQSRNPQIQYIRVLKMKKGSINVET
ncbi:MAG: hypothetical protein HY551_01840, partial [Elusimicrobia bacterium]|nr:hypothetical protein [Elusimicrobiota bacterium]